MPIDPSVYEPTTDARRGTVQTVSDDGTTASVFLQPQGVTTPMLGVYQAPGRLGTVQLGEEVLVLTTDGRWEDGMIVGAAVPAPAEAGTVTALDVSNFQQATLDVLIDHYRPSMVILRLFLPEEGISGDVSVAMAATARAKGCTLAGYFWAYRSSDPGASVNTAADLGARADIVFSDHNPLWIDCEDEKNAQEVVLDPGPDAAWLDAAKAAADARIPPVPLGIYARASWWNDPARMNGSTAFSTWPLWAANYDVGPPLALVPLWGGWTLGGLVGHQYNGGTVRDIKSVDAGFPCDLNLFLAAWSGT